MGTKNDLLVQKTEHQSFLYVPTWVNNPEGKKEVKDSGGPGSKTAWAESLREEKERDPEEASDHPLRRGDVW